MRAIQGEEGIESGPLPSFELVCVIALHVLIRSKVPSRCFLLLIPLPLRFSFFVWRFSVWDFFFSSVVLPKERNPETKKKKQAGRPGRCVP
jgi:hypothetical protein